MGKTIAATLAQKNGESLDLVLPVTSADLVRYSKDNSTAATVQEAIDEIEDNFQGEAPGIVARVEALEESQGTQDAALAAHSANTANPHKVTAAQVGAIPTGGNAGSATKLATARTIALSGAVTGSASFNGTANITIATTAGLGISNAGSRASTSYVVGDVALSRSGNTLTLTRSYQADVVGGSSNCTTTNCSRN